mmetsp:Transcript_126184/g.362943  ORF Transcript_126184/g.362943 Transcript_126184/m.362943 type:complete len:208 (+) Transcript_126184:299-922(+)
MCSPAVTSPSSRARAARLAPRHAGRSTSAPPRSNRRCSRWYSCAGAGSTPSGWTSRKPTTATGASTGRRPATSTWRRSSSTACSCTRSSWMTRAGSTTWRSTTSSSGAPRTRGPSATGRSCWPRSSGARRRRSSGCCGRRSGRTRATLTSPATSSARRCSWPCARARRRGCRQGSPTQPTCSSSLPRRAGWRRSPCTRAPGCPRPSS